MREVLFVKIEVDVANFRVRGNKLPGTQVERFSPGWKEVNVFLQGRSSLSAPPRSRASAVDRHKYSKVMEAGGDVDKCG